MHLQPMIAIVTNIDNDHLATHEGDFSRLKQSFVDFLHNLPFYGLAVLCADDECVRSIYDAVGRPFVTYGFAEGTDIRAVNVVRAGLQSRLQALRAGFPAARPDDQPAGPAQRANSLAAVAVATELDIADAAIQRALANFQGIDRRLQQLGEIRRRRARARRRRLRPPSDGDRRDAGCGAPGFLHRALRYLRSESPRILAQSPALRPVATSATTGACGNCATPARARTAVPR